MAFTYAIAHRIKIFKFCLVKSSRVGDSQSNGPRMRHQSSLAPPFGNVPLLWALPMEVMVTMNLKIPRSLGVGGILCLLLKSGRILNLLIGLSNGLLNYPSFCFVFFLILCLFQHFIHVFSQSKVLLNFFCPIHILPLNLLHTTQSISKFGIL